MAYTKQQQQNFAAIIDVWHKDVAAFAVDVFGPLNALRPKQIEFAKAFQQNKRITFKGGVGFGKTRSLAILIWWALFTHDDVQITVYGPNEGQLERGLWKELDLLYGKMDANFAAAFKVTARRIERTARSSSCFASFALASKENTSAARGVHMDNNFVVVDEATGVPDEVFDVLVNILRDKNAKLCLISNPSRTSGYFYNTWEGQIAPLWTKVHGRMIDNPNITEEDLREAELDYGGKESRLYRIMVDGEFPDGDSDGLIPKWAVDRAVAAEVEPDKSIPIIWGLDPADGGDRSVLCMRHDNKIIGLREIRGTDLMQLAVQVRDLYEATPQSQRPIAICVDANGVGNGAYTHLKYMNMPARKIMVTNSPTRNAERYYRLRDQLWWECREWFLDGGVSIPDNKDLRLELITPTYNSDNGPIKIEQKSQIRKRLEGNSPDYADALCLTFATSPIALGIGTYSRPLLGAAHMSAYE
jgi:hypothetical protein